MFFWMMLASLMGIVMFGNLYEKTKPQENFIAPVYQAMALSMYQQHVSSEYGYLDAVRINSTEANDYFNTATDGIVPLATVENGTISGVNPDNTVFPYIEGRLPSTYKPQNGTRTYLFCIDKNQQAEHVACNNSDVVRYIITVRAIPPRYDGADKMTALRAVSDATGNSRFVGMLQKAAEPLSEVVDSSGNVITEHQPLGATHFILSSGVAPVNSVYIPNFITCNLPMSDSDTSNVLGDSVEKKSYIIALSLVGGLQPGENLPVGATDVCTATTFSPPPEEEETP